MESSFSTGDRGLDAYRSRLIPSTIKALVCTRDWLNGNCVFLIFILYYHFKYMTLEFIFGLIYLTNYKIYVGSEGEVDGFIKDVLKFKLNDEDVESEGSSIRID